MGNLGQQANNIIVLYIVLIFVLILAFLVSLFTCLAINEDAKARGIKSRKLFAALGFFFPLVVAIVYLIVRNNLSKIQPKMCNHCRLTVNSSVNVCPQCGSAEFTDYLIPDNEKFRKRAKTYAITALISYVIVMIISLIVQFSGLFYTSNFARDNNSYNYNNGYQYNNNDDDNDYNYDDFFNQFGSGQEDNGNFSQDEPSLEQ